MFEGRLNTTRYTVLVVTSSFINVTKLYLNEAITTNGSMSKTLYVLFIHFYVNYMCYDLYMQLFFKQLLGPLSQLTL